MANPLNGRHNTHFAQTVSISMVIPLQKDVNWQKTFFFKSPFYQADSKDVNNVNIIQSIVYKSAQMPVFSLLSYNRVRHNLVLFYFNVLLFRKGFIFDLLLVWSL